MAGSSAWLAFAAVLVVASPAEAQRDPRVFAYLNRCEKSYEARLQDDSRHVVLGYRINAMSLPDGRGRLRVRSDEPFADGSRELVITVGSGESALLTGTPSPGSCGLSLTGMSRDSILSLARNEAERHDGRRRTNAWLRNGMILGALGVAYGVVYRELDQPGVGEADPFVVLGGTGVAITMGWASAQFHAMSEEEAGWRDNYRSLNIQVQSIRR